VSDQQTSDPMQMMGGVDEEDRGLIPRICEALFKRARDLSEFDKNMACKGETTPLSCLHPCMR